MVLLNLTNLVDHSRLNVDVVLLLDLLTQRNTFGKYL